MCVTILSCKTQEPKLLSCCALEEVGRGPSLLGFSGWDSLSIRLVHEQALSVCWDTGWTPSGCPEGWVLMWATRPVVLRGSCRSFKAFDPSRTPGSKRPASWCIAVLRLITDHIFKRKEKIWFQSWMCWAWGIIYALLKNFWLSWAGSMVIVLGISLRSFLWIRCWNTAVSLTPSLTQKVSLSDSKWKMIFPQGRKQTQWHLWRFFVSQC